MQYIYIYVTPLFAWTPWGLTTTLTLKYTPFGRFSTPMVQPMDGPHTHKYHHRPSQVGWYLRLCSLPELTKQLDAAAVVAAAAAVRVYVVASLGFDVNQRRSDGRTIGELVFSLLDFQSQSELSLSLSFHASLE